MYRFNCGNKFGSVSTRGADLKYLCRASKHFVTCFLQESILKNFKFTETVCDKVQVNFPLYTDKKNLSMKNLNDDPMEKSYQILVIDWLLQSMYIK